MAGKIYPGWLGSGRLLRSRHRTATRLGHRSRSRNGIAGGGRQTLPDGRLYNAGGRLSRRNLAFTESEWATLTTLANLPATLPGKHGQPVPVSDTERLRAALRRLGELARDSGGATDREYALAAELARLFAVPRVRGGSRAGGFEAGNTHSPRTKKEKN